MRTLLLSALTYAHLVGVARSRYWVCACWSRGRAPGYVPAGRVVACACWSRGRVPGQVPAGGTLDMRGRIFSLPLTPPPRGEGSLQLPYPLLHYVAQCIGRYSTALLSTPFCRCF
jgi:hypothetical protein